MESQSPQFAQTHPELDLLTGHRLAKLPRTLVRHGCLSSPSPSSGRVGVGLFHSSNLPVVPTRPRYARSPSPKDGEGEETSLPRGHRRHYGHHVVAAVDDLALLIGPDEAAVVGLEHGLLAPRDHRQ